MVTRPCVPVDVDGVVDVAVELAVDVEVAGVVDVANELVVDAEGAAPVAAAARPETPVPVSVFAESLTSFFL